MNSISEWFRKGPGVGSSHLCDGRRRDRILGFMNGVQIPNVST